MNRRAIASLGFGPQEELLRLAARSFGPYARRHGYDLHLHTGLADTSRPPAWSKIPILRELANRYELLVWLDADAVIVDGSVDIAQELRPGHVLYLVEHVVDGEVRPNTGVMMLRGGSAAVRFLEDVWALDAYREHRWWENAAVCELLGYGVDPPVRGAATEWRDKTRFLPGGWNWIPQARAPNPRIRHFPGFAVRTRRALMLAALLEARARAQAEPATRLLGAARPVTSGVSSPPSTSAPADAR